MSAVWRCRVCEAVNAGGGTCATCGAVAALVPAPAITAPPRPPLRRRVAEGVARRARRAGPVWRRPAPPSEPEPEVLEYADDEFERPRLRVLPLPGGCLFSVGPRRRRRWR